jgi:guanylate kinase
MARFIEKALGVPMLVSYTTRPKRENEINGVDHVFVTEADMPAKSQMLAYTEFGGYHYWMPIEDRMFTGLGVFTYVIDEKGVQTLKERFSEDFDIVSLLVKRDVDLLIKQVGEERVKRDLDRISIPESDYDYVITNNARIEDFLADSLLTFKEIIK